MPEEALPRTSDSSAHPSFQADALLAPSHADRAADSREVTMGRTLPTIVQLIHCEEDSWRSFRRALRKEDQELFDLLWVYCRRHAQAAAMANREIPFETLTMAML